MYSSINSFVKKTAVILMAAASILTSCTPRRAKAPVPNTETAVSGAFASFAGHFSRAASFAIAEVSGRRVLLVSHETFGSATDSDMQAVEASIFALDSDNKIVSLGSVRSQGTLYPVSLLDGKIMTAGHHFVYTYSIRGDVPELVLESCSEGEGPEMEAMFRTFESGTPILFNRQPASVQGAD